MRPSVVGLGVVALAAASTFGYIVGSGDMLGPGGIALGAAVGFGAAVGWLLTARVDRHHQEKSGADYLSLELDRARRRSHPVAILCVELSGADDTASLGKGVRNMDHLVVRSDSALLVMPEADRTEAEAALNRLRSEFPTSVGMATARIAVFPEDGVTEHALIAAVDGEPFFAEPLGKVALHEPGRRADGAGDVATDMGGRTG